MNQTIEVNLYRDPQAAQPAAFCPRCGGALWLPSLRCLRCEQEAPYDPA
jgi:hypothetical protein